MTKWDAGMETERMGDDGNGLFKKNIKHKIKDNLVTSE